MLGRSSGGVGVPVDGRAGGPVGDADIDRALVRLAEQLRIEREKQLVAARLFGEEAEPEPEPELKA